MSFNIKIENPCQENWDRMHSNIDGKFCGSCQKNVIDFTSKTSREIAQIINDKQGNICGRFTSNQLNQEYSVGLAPRAEINRYKSIAASFLVMLGIESAQGQEVPTKSHVEMIEKTQTSTMIGDTILAEQNSNDRTYVIEGEMIDAKTKQPIPFQKIYNKEKTFGALSDFDGRFLLQIPSKLMSDSIQIVVGSHEFIEQQMTIYKSDFDRESRLRLNFQLTQIEGIEMIGIIVVEPTKKTRKRRK